MAPLSVEWTLPYQSLRRYLIGFHVAQFLWTYFLNWGFLKWLLCQIDIKLARTPFLMLWNWVFTQISTYLFKCEFICSFLFYQVGQKYLFCFVILDWLFYVVQAGLKLLGSGCLLLQPPSHCSLCCCISLSSLFQVWCLAALIFQATTPPSKGYFFLILWVLSCFLTQGVLGSSYTSCSSFGIIYSPGNYVSY